MQTDKQTDIHSTGTTSHASVCFCKTDPIDIHTDIQRDRQADRQTDTALETPLMPVFVFVRQILQTQIDRHTYRQTDIQTDRRTYTQIYIHTDIQTYIHTDIQIDRQTDSHRP